MILFQYIFVISCLFTIKSKSILKKKLLILLHEVKDLNHTHLFEYLLNHGEVFSNEHH